MKLADSNTQAEKGVMKAVGETVTEAVAEAVAEAIDALAAGASIEVSPRQILGEGTVLSAFLPVATQVYVPFLPKADFGDTIRACRALVCEGFDPVPHIAARQVESGEQLRDWLAELQAIGVDALMLIAGDRLEPAGPFANTLAIFESGMLETHGFRRIGVAGHPEGHPVADVVALDHALRIKLEYARANATDMWIVSQFAFGSAQVIAWLERLRSKGFEAPVRVGLPAPASLKTLIAYAAYCGVEASARVLARRPGAARLLARWTPDGLVQDLGHYRLNHPGSLLAGIHLYSFGGLAEAAHWLAGLRLPDSSCEAFRTHGAA